MANPNNKTATVKKSKTELGHKVNKKWRKLSKKKIASLLNISKKKVKKVIKVLNKYAEAKRIAPAERNGKQGVLVWDHLIFNELYFVASDSGKTKMLYSTFSNQEAKDEWSKLLKKYKPAGNSKAAGVQDKSKPGRTAAAKPQTGPDADQRKPAGK